MKYYVFTVISAFLLLTACSEEKVQTADELLDLSIESLEKKSVEKESTDTDEVSTFHVNTIFNKTWDDYTVIWNNAIQEMIEIEPEFQQYLSHVNDVNEAEKVETSDGISYKYEVADYVNLIINTDKENDTLGHSDAPKFVEG